MNSTELSVFLGNPGKEYAKTRHNFGWMAGEALSLFRQLRLQSKFNGSWGDIKSGDHREIVLFPGTFMNKSGLSVSAALSFFKIDILREPEKLLVVHDDLELPFGTIELRAGGGLAGHNGLKSIRDQLGTDAFLRLRLGIGRPARGSVSSWVLSRFTADEEARLQELLDETSEILEPILLTGHRTAAPFRKEILHF